MVSIEWNLIENYDFYMAKWIKEMPEDYYNQSSFFEDDVMLWQNDKVYARGTGQWH